MDAQRLKELKNLISGTVATAGEAVYSKAAEAFFRTISPSVVVQPASAEDVAVVVRFATKYSIPLAIRSGGHNNITSRLTDNTLLIDMSGLASVEVVDKSQRLVQVGTGALWHRVANALAPHGWAISSGDNGSVGVGGLATTTGVGWMIRKYGPVVDSIVSAEVVTADGQIIVTSETNHPDLFWAIRGGGSNFGVVTHITLRAQPVKDVWMGMITYSIEDTSRVLRGWRDVMRQVPPELSSMLMTLPGKAGAPASIVIRGCYADNDQLAAERAYGPLFTLARDGHHELKLMPYKDTLDHAPPRSSNRVIINNICMREFTDQAIDTITKLCATTPPIFQIRHVAGAMNQQPLEATAFSQRDSEILIVNPTSLPADATDHEITSSLNPWRTIRPLGNGCFINFLTEDTGFELAKAYRPTTLKRLRTIKSKYDPNNVFKNNYNIRPAE